MSTPKQPQHVVQRGGACFNAPHNLSSARNVCNSTDNHFTNNGFRVALRRVK